MHCTHWCIYLVHCTHWCIFLVHWHALFRLSGALASFGERVPYTNFSAVSC